MASAQFKLLTMNVNKCLLLKTIKQIINNNKNKSNVKTIVLRQYDWFLIIDHVAKNPHLLLNSTLLTTQCRTPRNCYFHFKRNNVCLRRFENNFVRRNIMMYIKFIEKLKCINKQDLDSQKVMFITPHHGHWMLTFIAQHSHCFSQSDSIDWWEGRYI